MAAEAHGSDLVHVVVLLSAGVIAVPIFKRLGLGSVLGKLRNRPIWNRFLSAPKAPTRSIACRGCSGWATRCC